MEKLFLFKCGVCQNHNSVSLTDAELEYGKHVSCAFCKARYLISKKRNKENMWGGLVAGALAGAAFGGFPGAVVGGILGTALGSGTGTSAQSEDKNP